MMEDIDRLKNLFADIWLNIALFVRESTIYIDHAATEWLHWHTSGKAYTFLKDAGALSVHELTELTHTLSDVKIKDCQRAVIISTAIDASFYERAFKMVMEKNVFNRCVIITAAHPSVMMYSDKVSPSSKSDYVELETRCKMFLKQKDHTMAVIFQPMFISPIDNGLFVTPPFADLMPPLNDISNYSHCAIDHLINLFHNLFTYLGLKEDIYSMGKFSEYVAEKLELLPEAVERRNNLDGVKGKGVSLIFIDRTLDLCAPTSNNTESLLARILSTLPCLPNHCNDIAINMSPLFYDLPEKTSQLIKVPGCLASSNLINLLIEKKQKEVLTIANKMLIDILSMEENLKTKENAKPKLATRISAHSLEKLINKFKDISDLSVISEPSKKLQVVLAVIQALTSEKTSQLELLISLEKLILQNIAVSRESTSMLGQFSNIIRTREKRGLNTDNILALLVHIYALAGTEIQFSSQQEEQLKDAIADAILEDITKFNKDAINSKKYQEILNSRLDNDEAMKEKSVIIAKRIISILHEVAQQRAPLHNYISLMRKSNSQEIVRRIGILQQLLTDMFHPDKLELPDLHQRSSLFTSTALNLFSMGRKKRHPCDNDWIIIYIVGGVTPDEVREAKEIVSSFKQNYKVTIAGSKLLKPIDIVDMVLQNVNC